MLSNIDGKTIGHGHPPYIIAELSGNHNGSLQRALDTITAAAKCGADAIKLQTYTADTMTIPCQHDDFLIHGGLWDGYNLYDLYQWAHTPYEWHETLFRHARQAGITCFSTPFDESAVDLLESLGAPAYKIASFEVTDLPLIRYVARTRKPMILSTGMANPDEIHEAVATARDAGCQELILLHCVSAYPAPLAEANLMTIPDMAQRFGTLTGLSDHTEGISAATAAIALGACAIEKHFTLSRADKGPDSEFSLEPAELTTLCRTAREVWQAIGVAGYNRQPSESANLKFRRSLYFVRELAVGQKITEADVRRIRPGYGLAPKHYDAVIGKTVTRHVTPGTAVTWELIQ
ncbi:pseudaminic acid synthase [Chrysiogenes arsenatis]|uniref:pseudaminic acid synthase n=1 Tax=Chrysiogenes arsenatis TaxID=309797 RepID=UPI0004162493|nr:pseudaminic acid synthase [Chrysiogenes arsenatis]